MGRTTKKEKYHFTKEEIGKFDPIDFEDDLAEELKDPEFKREFQKLGPKYAIFAAIVEGRRKKKISQKTLAKRLGTGQSAISRLESGLANPSYKFLQKLAKALDSELVIEFR